MNGMNSHKRVLKDYLPLELRKLLDLPGVDWSGGSLGQSPLYSRPTPKLRPGSTVCGLLVDWIQKLEAISKPAEQLEILQMLSKLQLHFPNPLISQQQMMLILQDYLVDLAEYPTDIIEQAILDYRRGDNLYFPKVGQLLKIAEKYLFQRQTKLKRLRKIQEVSGK
jgi:hypothetical protein